MFILKNKFYFSILYFSILIIDIIVKFGLDAIPFRFITKPLIVVSLVLFYWMNSNEKSKRNFVFMVLALFFFLLGDIFLIFKDVSLLFSLGMLGFIFGKLFFTFRFSNQNDFKLVRLLPVVIFCFVYIFVVLNIIYDNLGDYFIPVLVYLFVAMLTLQFAYLRKSGVDTKSYLSVGIGILFSVVADSVAVLAQFYENNFFYDKVTVILFYGISQYLIVMGIIEEKAKIDNSFYEDVSIGI
ncbi:hypothetical protein FG167_11920 [Lacinutrix sp. WUR7]|uniref:lysoplasmalogenase n=1 Tax=Lacinutrix sp. WUR7 TaxID=2653681 RepID=UPI00193CA2CA|nr:lysoplasmalogenase [Lacinutrix sp. WUR7]QRM89907.1 hypothetical protein FG167_11920 [Lacinutrix sp. WUR7]